VDRVIANLCAGWRTSQILRGACVSRQAHIGSRVYPPRALTQRAPSLTSKRTIFASRS